jgi:hypothetical protein
MDMRRLVHRAAWGLAGLCVGLSAMAQERACDDKRPYLSWNDCVGSVILVSGQRYEGPFRAGAPNGLGVAVFNNGYRYIGQFRNGAYHGTGALVDRGFKVLQAGVWADGKFVEGKEIDIAPLLAGGLRQGIPAATQSMAAGAAVAPVAAVTAPAQAPAPASASAHAPQAVAPQPARPATPPPLPAREQVAPAVALAAPAVSPAPSLSPIVQYAQRRALVIGNDNYQSVQPLRNAVADAQGMATSLQRAGYQVSLHLDLDEKRFKQVLRNFRHEVQGGDEVLFFFAGHGVEIAGTNYLLPVDVRVSGAYDDRDRDQLREDSVDLKRFMSELEDRKTKFALAVIDACREDPFPKASGGRSIASRAGLAQTTPATGQMIIFSAGAGQLALDALSDRDPSKNGVFTRVFLSEMDKPGIPIDRVLKNVRTEVSRLARSVGRTQTPAIYDQSEGDFFFRVR